MTQPASAVRLRDVTFRWKRGPRALDIAMLDIAAGERVFVHGPSGCGKSTLLALVAGVLHPTTGDVQVLGHSLSAMTSGARDRFRAEHLGVIFQTFNLLPFLSITDNVRLGYDFSHQRRARVTAAEGGAEGAIGRLLGQLGLEPEIRGQAVRALSIGQQQRVAVARALIGGPDLVIADEPTSALDAGARDRFLDLLLGECDAAGSTLLFVSHDLGLAGHFDRSIDLAQLNRASAVGEGATCT